MAVDTKERLMTKADQMDEESSLLLLSTTMRGTSLRASLTEKVERFNLMVNYTMASGRVV